MISPDVKVNGPIDELIEAAKHKKRLEAALREVNKTIADMKEIVLEKFQQEGTKSIRRDDGTVYTQKRFSVTPKESKEAVVDALMSCGYDDMVPRNYNYMSLCSLIKEMDAAGEEIPPELVGALDITEDFTIVVRTQE